MIRTKNLYYYFNIILYKCAIVFIFCINNKLAVAQNCPSSEIEKMRFSATQAVYEYAEKFKITQITDSLKIQHKYVDTILRYLCAIYNTTGKARDSIFYFFCYSSDKHDISFLHGFNQFSVYADSGVINLDTWDIKKSFGITALDSFVKVHNLEFKIEYWDFVKMIVGELKTDTWCYDRILHSFFKKYIPSISVNARTSTQGNLWYYRKNGDTIFFHFSYGWGDCQSGCMYRREWIIPVLNNFTVLPVRNIPRSLPLNMQLNIPNSLDYCDYETPNATFSKKTNTNYDNELGGIYGKWYVNNKLVDDTSPIIINKFEKNTIEHRSNFPNGIFIYQTVYVHKIKKLELTNFFGKDSLILCRKDLFNWKQYLNQTAYDYLKSQTIKEITTNKNKIDITYSPYVINFTETRKTCNIYSDSIFIKATIFPEHYIKDTYYLKYGDTLTLISASNVKSTYWRIGYFLAASGEILKLTHPEWERDSIIKGIVRTSNEHRCDSTTEFYIKFTGYKKDLGNRNFKKSIALIPNPANTHITIVNKDVLQISIYSMNGKKVLETSKKLIDITTLAEGVYIVAGKDIHNHTFTARLLVRRE